MKKLMCTALGLILALMLSAGAMAENATDTDVTGVWYLNSLIRSDGITLTVVSTEDTGYILRIKADGTWTADFNDYTNGGSWEKNGDVEAYVLTDLEKTPYIFSLTNNILSGIVGDEKWILSRERSTFFTPSEAVTNPTLEDFDGVWSLFMVESSGLQMSAEDIDLKSSLTIENGSIIIYINNKGDITSAEMEGSLTDDTLNVSSEITLQLYDDKNYISWVQEDGKIFYFEKISTDVWYANTFITNRVTYNADSSLRINADGTWVMKLAEAIDAGLWERNDDGVYKLTNSNATTYECVPLEDGTLSMAVNETTLIFSHEQTSAFTIGEAVTNPTLEDFNGVWSLFIVESSGLQMSAEDIDLKSSLTIENGSVINYWNNKGDATSGKMEGTLTDDTLKINSEIAFKLYDEKKYISLVMEDGTNFYFEKTTTDIWYLNSVIYNGAAFIKTSADFIDSNLRINTDGTWIIKNNDAIDTGLWEKNDDGVYMLTNSNATTYEYVPLEDGMLSMTTNEVTFIFGHEQAAIFVPGEVIAHPVLSDFNGTWSLFLIETADGTQMYTAGMEYKNTLTIKDGNVTIDTNFEEEVNSEEIVAKLKNGKLVVSSEMALQLHENGKYISSTTEEKETKYYKKVETEASNNISLTSDEWICSSCGNHATGKFCNNCGAARSSENTTKSVKCFTLEEAVAYLLSPNDPSMNVLITEKREGRFRVTTSAGTYMGLVNQNKNEYLIELIALSSTSGSGTQELPYDYKSEEFIALLNYLMEKDGKTVVSIIPMYDTMYTALDSNGDSYLIQVVYSESMIVIGLLNT